MSDINGVEFTPQEEEAFRIALDRMENAEEEDAANATAPNAYDSDAAIEADKEEADAHLQAAAIVRSARHKFGDAMRGDRIILMSGNPADGFTLVGPCIPNDPSLEEYIENALHGDYWWYVPYMTLETAWEKSGIIRENNGA